MKKLLRALYYRIAYFVYYRLYAPVHNLYWRIQEARHPRDIGHAPCQICGGQHLEQNCPRTKEMGF